MLRMLDLLQAQPFDLAILSTCRCPAWTATCWPDASATPVMRSGRYGFLHERRRQFAEPPLHAVRLDIREVLPVRAQRALVEQHWAQAWARISSRLILSYST